MTEDRTDREQRLWLTDADRAIAAVFDHLEQVTPEMRIEGARGVIAGSLADHRLRDQAEGAYLAMLAVARKAAEEQT